MRPGDLLSGSAFQTALRTVFLFLVLFAVSASLLTSAVVVTLKQELKAQIIEESALYEQIFQRDGERGLIQSIKDIQKTLLGSQRVLAAFDKDGLNLFGGQPPQLLPDFIGWRYIKSPLIDEAGQDKPHYLAQQQTIGQVSIIIGRSLRPIHQVKQRLTKLSLIFAALFALPALIIGLLLSYRSLDKLNIIEQRLRSVSEGELDVRLPISKDNDQIDRVARQINLNLDRMQALVESIRATAVAIAHDLKTPLSHAQLSLHGALDALESQQDPEPAIQAALDETVQLNTLFETILRISRIQSRPRDPASFKTIPLSDIAGQVIEFLASLAEDNQQQLQLTGDVDTPLTGDPKMLQQALYNLVSNSIQHAGRNTTIRIGITDETDHSSLWVEDNGVGIPVEQLDNVTALFSRLDSARSQEGNGLGLALVDAVVEHHNGHLEFASLSPGLRVSIRLPKL